MIDRLVHLLPLGYTDAVVTLGSGTVGALAGIVGCLAVLRRRSMVGDAMAHAALPGVALAFMLSGGSRAPALLLAGALLAGACAAVCVVLLERVRRVPTDAAIGVVLSVAFSLGIVLLTVIAQRPDADQAGLDRYLFGQAASLLLDEVRVMLVMTVGAVGLVWIGRHPLRAVLFDRSFASSVGLSSTAVDIAATMLLVVAAVTGLQVVGAILMVSLLVAPAVAARQWTRSLRTMLPLAGALGAAMGVTGALLSSRLEVPTGPVVVLVATLTVLFSLLVAPGRGVIAQARAGRKLRSGPAEVAA